MKYLRMSNAMKETVMGLVAILRLLYIELKHYTVESLIWELVHRRAIRLKITLSPPVYKLLRCDLGPRCRELLSNVVLNCKYIAERTGRSGTCGWALVVTTSLPKTPNLPESALNPHSKSSFTNGIDDRVAQKTGHEDTSGDVSSAG